MAPMWGGLSVASSRASRANRAMTAHDRSPAARVRDSSRISQFFANFQSRITVSGEIFRTSALHLTLTPATNAAEEPHLAALSFPFVLRRQCSQRIVNINQVVGSFAGDRQVLDEGHP